MLGFKEICVMSFVKNVNDVTFQGNTELRLVTAPTEWGITD
jgi:hypothetical protein